MTKDEANQLLKTPRFLNPEDVIKDYDITKEDAVNLLLSKGAHYSQASSIEKEYYIKNIPKEYFDDKDFILEVMTGKEINGNFANNPYIYVLLNEKLKKDKKILALACKRSCYTKSYSSSSFSSNFRKPFGIYDIFQYLPEEIKKNEKLMLKLWSNGRRAKYSELPEVLKNNADVCFYYAKCRKHKYSPGVIHEMPNTIIDSKEFLIKYNLDVNNNEYMLNKILKDKDVLREALNHTELRNRISDKVYECEMILLKKTNQTEEIKKDNYEFAKQNLVNVYSLLSDVDFFIEYASSTRSNEVRGSNLIHFFDNHFYADKALMLKIIENNAESIKIVSEDLKKDYDLTKLALQKDPKMLPFVDVEFRKDYDLVEMAIKGSKKYNVILEFADETLKDNEDLVRLSVSIDSQSLKYASDRLKNKPEIVIISVADDSSYISYAHPELIQKVGTENPLKGLEALLFSKKLDLTLPKNNIKSNSNKL